MSNVDTTRNPDNWDQPPEADVHDDARQLPPAKTAAERVHKFIAWWGDGDIAADLPSGPPLYARDLEALVRETQAEAAPVGAASDIEGDESCMTQ